MNKAKNKQRKPGISLCMIVKNEAETIRECLSSALPAVDEVVILVDNSSTDETKEKALNHVSRTMGPPSRHKANTPKAPQAHVNLGVPYKIMDYKWPGSFSEARNLALSHCDREWVLIVDGHETIEEASKLRELWEKHGEDADLILFRLRNDDYNPPSMHYEIRMFRNNGRIRYKSAMHNYLVAEDSNGEWSTDALKELRVRFAPEPVFVHKRSEKLLEERAYQRSEMMSVMRERAFNNPRDADANFYLGGYYFEIGNYDAAALNYRCCYEHSGNRYQRYMCCVYLGHIFEKKSDNVSALNWYWQAAQTEGNELLPTAWLNLGSLYLKMSKESPGMEIHYCRLGLDLLMMAVDREFPLTGAPMPLDHFSGTPYLQVALAYGHLAKAHVARSKKYLLTADYQAAAEYIKEGMNWCGQGAEKFPKVRGRFLELLEQYRGILAAQFADMSFPVAEKSFPVMSTEEALANVDRATAEAGN